MQTQIRSWDQPAVPQKMQSHQAKPQVRTDSDRAEAIKLAAEQLEVQRALQKAAQV